MYKLHIVSKKAIYFITCETKREAKQQAKLFRGLDAKVFVRKQGQKGFWL
jgi:hypothetical protein